MKATKGQTATYFILQAKQSDGKSRLKRSSLEEHIKYCLRGCILTYPGERLFNKTLGSQVRDLLFRSFSNSLMPEIKSRIKSAILQSEPRIELIDLDTITDKTDKSRILVSVSYRVKETRKMDQLRLAIHP